MHRSRFSLLSVVWLAALLALSPSLLAQESPPADTPPRDIDALVRLYDRPAPADGFFAQVDALTLPQDAPLGAETVGDLATWSQIAFMTGRHGVWSIYRMKPNFNDVVPALVSDEHNMYPSLQPRGAQRIVFVSERHNNVDIYSARPDGSDVVRLTDHPADDLMPVWSPDGQRIAFQSERTGESDIYVMDADGSDLGRLTSSDGYDGHPTWSPDGSHIAFSSNATGLYQIWLMTSEGAWQRPITNFGLAALYPSWSPDGTDIAFSGIGGINAPDYFFDLHLMHPDGTNVRVAAQEGATDIRSVAWAPDASHATYIATSYEQHGNEWYVTSSTLHMARYGGGRLTELGTYPYDNIVWSASWASTDSQPPNPCVVNTPAARAWRSAFISWLATDDLSGVAAYDVEWRPAGATNWAPLTLPTPLTTFTLDERAPGDIVEWRCRATDVSGNRADWAAATVKRTLVDGAPPSSTVSAVATVDSDTVQVTWRGADFGSGVATYDVWVRAGTTGDWTRWQTATTALSAPFTGQPGQTYAFRSQAIDRAGIREAWRPAAQAQATLGAPDAPTAPDTDDVADTSAVPNAPAAPTRSLLPLVTAVSGSPAAQDMLSLADWPTLGGNAAHTGVNAGDRGASRYARVWSTDVGAPGMTIPEQVTFADGIVMLTVEGDYSHTPRIIAINVETGIPAWSYEPNDELSHPPAIAHGAAYFGENSYNGSCRIFAADLHTGRRIWESGSYCDYFTSFQHPLVVGNRVYIANRYSVQEILAATGEPGWESDQSRTNMDGGWAPAYDGGRIFYLPDRHSINELNAASGQLLWSYGDLHGDYLLDFLSAPVVTSDALISAGYDLVALNTRRHTRFWTVAAQTENYFSSTTMPALAGRVVYALRGPTLLAYNLDTGAELWHFTANGPLLSAPVVAGKYIYVASASRTYVLNRLTHELEWDTGTGGILSVANGYLFIAEPSNPATGLDPATLHAYRAQEP